MRKGGYALNIGEKIKARREDLNLKVKDIAQEIGVAESTYRDWENGRQIQGEPYTKISAALDISLGELFGLSESKNSEKIKEEIEIIESSVKKIKKHVNKIL